MSSQDHERLLEGGQEPAVPAAAPVASAGFPRPRRTTRSATEKSEGTRARTRAKAGTEGRTAVRAKAPTPKAPTPKAPTTPKAGTAKATTTKATPAKATTTKVTPAKRASAKARPVAGPARAKVSTTAPVVAGPAATKIVTAPAAKKVASRPAAEKTAAGPRPTPFPRTRTRVAPAGPATPSAIVQTAPDAVPTPVTLRIIGRHRRPVRTHRRPAMMLAAALFGVLAVGTFALTTWTEARAGSGSAVSVAHELGLTAHTVAEPAPAVASRQLGLLAASRAHREALEAAAAHAQRVADAKAIEAARPKAVLPVKGAVLTSGFGYRWGTLHAGIDLAAPIGTPEYSVMDGVVLKAGPASGFGQAVYIQHANGDVTVYGHMEKILVTTGQVVKAGQEIALLGAEGEATGPHLHFEVHVGGIEGSKIDPIPWLAARGVHV